MFSSSLRRAVSVTAQAASSKPRRSAARSKGGPSETPQQAGVPSWAGKQRKGPPPSSNGNSRPVQAGGRSNSSPRDSRQQGRPSDVQLPSAPVRARDILLKKKAPSQPAALPGGHAAAAAAAAAATAVVGSQLQADPTFVPRDPAVKDGPWSAVDAGLVVAAQQDTLQPAPSPAATGPQGFVLLCKTPEELQALAVQLGQPAYRGKQLLDGILKGAKSVADIKGLPQEFRQQLQQLGVKTGRSVVHHKVTSPDGTAKLLLQLDEGRVIETVGIPVADEQDSSGRQRLTVCVSSQVGCPMRCSFCATGQGGWARNLKPHEIVDQVLGVSELYGQRVSNVVFMGMGEPLLNLSNVVAAATFMKEQLGLSGRAITISTVGVPNAIAALAQHRLTATLAVSIHAPDQQLREALIPSAKVYPITALMRDCTAYFKATGRRVTFEYTLMGGTNDAPEHAQALADLLRAHNLMSHVNLIPWNPVDESDYQRPSRNRVVAFQRVLEAAGLPVSVRSTRGLEAAAACGQLRNSFQKQGLENPQPLS